MSLAQFRLYAAIVISVACGVSCWYLIDTRRDEKQRNELNLKANRVMFDRMVTADMEQRMEP